MKSLGLLIAPSVPAVRGPQPQLPRAAALSLSPFRVPPPLISTPRLSLSFLPPFQSFLSSLCSRLPSLPVCTLSMMSPLVM